MNSFVEKAKKKHGNKFDYSKTEYVSLLKRVVIICPIHGEFEQVAKAHLGINRSNGLIREFMGG